MNTFTGRQRVKAAFKREYVNLTPHFGYAPFFIKGVASYEIKTTDIYWGAFLFWILMELKLIICVIFSETITWLPSLLVK
jgi:TRAP-type mannitol/chloroaromatic compound transport system permease large subunit